jgi:hypothetical protein
MKKSSLFVIALLMVVPLSMTACNKSEKSKEVAAPAAATAGSVTILSPKDNEVLESGTGIKLTYDVHLSPTGNHLHIYVDDQSPVISHDVTACPCSISLPPLSAGPHEVAVKEATVSHALTGVESSVKFTVK